MVMVKPPGMSGIGRWGSGGSGRGFIVQKSLQSCIKHLKISTANYGGLWFGT